MDDWFDEDPYLLHSIDVPPRLRAMLRQYGHVANIDLAHAVAKTLGFPTGRLGAITARVLLRIMREMETVVDGKNHLATGAEMAYPVTEGLTVDNVRDVMRALGGGREKLNSRVDYWDVDARKLLADFLTPTLEAWLERPSTRNAQAMTTG